MHSSRMRTARSSSRPGGLHPPPPEQTPPEQTPPAPDQAHPTWEQTPSRPSTPLGADSLDKAPPWTRQSPAARHAGIAHLPAARHAGIPPPTLLWTEFLTHASENITLPQTSFLRAVIKLSRRKQIQLVAHHLTSSHLTRVECHLA